jgi:hypothetical protein
MQNILPKESREIKEVLEILEAISPNCFARIFLKPEIIDRLVRLSFSVL